MELLVSRGLEIPSSERAKQQLLSTSYYDLISGYKDVFLVEKSDPKGEDRFISGNRIQ